MPEEIVETEQIFSSSDPALEEIAKAQPALIRELTKLDPRKTAATFGSLLTVPALQANCFRLEMLVHLSAAYCHGQTTPSVAFIRRAFEYLGSGHCGRMEDPSEDVFVSLVNTSNGNFRIFEGIREGNGFHLQRILNIVESMPDHPIFNRIRTSIGCLLKLSEAIAARANIHENSLGQEMPLDHLPKTVASRLLYLRGLVRFTRDDLIQLGINPDDLSDFSFDPTNLSHLKTEVLGHTQLERRPLAIHGESVHVLLPTAVASAITRFVIESGAVSLRKTDAFERALANDFGRLFYEMPVLGEGTGERIELRRMANGWIGAVTINVDHGRFLDLVLCVDTLAGFNNGELSSTNDDPEAFSLALKEHLKQTAAEAAGKPNFLDAITLVVLCGFGRAFGFLLEKNDLPKQWRLAVISAHDIVTLSWLPDFEQLSLWRLLDAQKAIEREGAALVNVNGLLNLVAWSRELDGHLVPHGQLPDGFISAGNKSLVMVRQNAMRDLRHSVLKIWNPRRVLDPNRRWVRVRKFGKSIFDEENEAPIYASEEDVFKGKLRAVYVAARRAWWIEIVAPEHASRDSVYEHWRMLCTWLGRAAPILDEAYPKLPVGPISFHLTFAYIPGATRGPVKPKTRLEISSLFRISTDANHRIIKIAVGEGFHDGLVQAENVAERSLVEALVAGAEMLAHGPTDTDKKTNVIQMICPSPEARWMHRFEARSFRDFVATEINASPTLIDPIDAAALKIGIGWQARSRDSGPEISGLQECTSFLNKVVQQQLDALCAELKCCNRSSFVTAVLHNYEAAAHERDLWRRTSQANIALHNDKNAAVQAIVQHHARLNACFLASRILVEAAVCECPLETGQVPGRLEISRMMARAALIYHLGGWSDTIHWGAMEPRVRITPLGDVHTNHSFMDEVYEPFGRASGEILLKQAVDSYGTLYTQTEERAVKDVLELKFLDAWEAEFGISLDGMREFLDEVEDSAKEPPKIFCRVPRSWLIGKLVTAASIPVERAYAALGLLTLAPRPEWRKVAAEFKDKDWFPWRFRRRLAVLRRPLFQVDDGTDPTTIFAPGLLRDAIVAMAGWLYHGEIPSSQARSSEMRRWIGHANNVQRVEFNTIVTNRMRELGWEAQSEVKLTKILNRSFDRDYGDVDVLAWRPDSGRVLVIECKDLQFQKTLGEVAEQLTDFRGELRADGKPDHLKRHLDRLEILRSHDLITAKSLKLSSPVQIEGHLVFKNPVPMRYAWNHMASKIRLSLFTELDQL